MKKCFAMLLCACILCALPVTAFASEAEPDYIAEYEAQYGKMPVASDYSSDEEYQAAYDVWLAGFKPYTERRYQEWLRQKAEAEEAARLAAEEEDRKAAEEQAVSIETTPIKPTESAGSKHDNTKQPPVDSYFTGSDYPVGSIIDSDGIVWSPDGTRLSPVREPGTTPAAGPDEDGPLLSDVLADPDNPAPVSDADTLALIAGLISDIATDPSVSTVEDLRPADSLVEVLTGMKALVTSIFGEYTPVTTTSVVSQTIGNDTQQYLLETVAPGAAGVDYEWVAGVVLFAIMLFCFMKLLGGVLK